MELTVFSLLGGIVMLIVGLVSYGVLHRTIYPALALALRAQEGLWPARDRAQRLDGTAQGGHSAGISGRRAAIRGPGVEPIVVMTR
jgi:hypothetical protein